MPQHCGFNWNLPDCMFNNTVGSTASAAVPAAWDSICKSFVTGAAGLMQKFAQWFAAIPDVDPAKAGISRAYAASLGIAAVIAVLLMFGQVIRTAWTHDGTALAQGVSGLAKTVLTWLATAAVASAALAASDQVTRWTVGKTFGSQQAFAIRLGHVVNWGTIAGGPPGQATVGASVALVIALIGVVLLIVLWFEMLLRNAALAVLLAVSPISAAGQMSETTRTWWQRTVSACIQLIILKPVVALVFAVGFAMAGGARGFEGVLAGLLAIGLAAFAWPVIARFFTFATVQSTSSGLATALGFAAGRLSGSGGGGGGPAGAHPDQWSRQAERQTTAAREGALNSGAETGAAPGGVAGTAGAGGTGPGGIAGGSGDGAGAAGGGAGAAAAMLGSVLLALHRAGSATAGRMEQTAGHAGMPGAYPYATVGGQRPAPSRSGRAPQGHGTPPPSRPAPETPPAETPPVQTPPAADRSAATPPAEPRQEQEQENVRSAEEQVQQAPPVPPPSLWGGDEAGSPPGADDGPGQPGDETGGGRQP